MEASHGEDWHRRAQGCNASMRFDESQLLRKQLRVREVLVQTRSRMISLCRSLLRQEGIRVPSGGAPSFVKRVRALELPGELRDAIEPLLETHEQVCAQVDAVDKKVEQAVKDDERVQRLTTVPSVGPVTAATFIAIVDDVGRSESSHKLQSYLCHESTARERSSRAGTLPRPAAVGCARFWSSARGGFCAGQTLRASPLSSWLCASRNGEANASRRWRSHENLRASCSP